MHRHRHTPYTSTRQERQCKGFIVRLIFSIDISFII
uniref:Uncharacterized protein n=1 Tax=Anguilla anguilla TaxID=7936 RepID=A0A0E9QZH8_ANGAN